MNYEQFKSAVIRALQKDIPDPKVIDVRTIMKNNGVQLDGLIIREGGASSAPTIYLDGYYSRYRTGMAFHTLYAEILKTCRAYREGIPIDTGFLTDYAKARDRVAYKLVHAGRNEALLEEVPHIPFLDLAVVFYCLMENAACGDPATVLIYSSQVELWGIAPDTLYADAMRNTPRMLPQCVRDIREVLGQIDEDITHIAAAGNAGKDPAPAGEAADGGCPFTDEAGAFPILVVSNQKNLFGAACILYEDLLAAIADRMRTDLIILPSSVHEVLILPSRDRSCYPMTHQIVKDVNSAALLPDEILSDHAYYYSRQTGRISIESC